MQTVTCACGRQLKGFPGATVRCVMCGKSTPVRGDAGQSATGPLSPAPQPAAAAAAPARSESPAVAPARTVTATFLEVSRRAPVRAVAFTPHGRLLAGGGEYDAVVLWDMESGQEIQKLPGNGGTTYAVAFSPDGARLASGGEAADAGDALVLSDPRSGKRLAHWGDEKRLQGGAVRCLAFSPDGDQVAIGTGNPDNRLRLWDMEAASQESLLGGMVQADAIAALAFSPDGRTLAFGGGGVNGVQFWSLHSQKSKHPWSMSAPVTALAYSPDGKRLAAADARAVITIWDCFTGTIAREMRRSDPAHLAALTVSPDGRWLACADGNGVSLWDHAAGALAVRFEGHTEEVQSVAFSPDGRLVASGSLDGFIKVWSVAADEPAPAHEEPVSSPSGIFRRQPPAASADTVHFRCACGAALRTGKQNAGKRTRCPHCGVPIAVPAE